MKLASIRVVRPWLSYQLFDSKRIGVKGTKKNQWSEKTCPYIVEQVIVAKDLLIEGIEMTNQQKSESSELKVNASISVLGFGGAKGGYSSQYAKNSASFDSDKGTYRVFAPSIIGYICSKFPDFPQIDCSQDQSYGSPMSYGAINLEKSRVQHLDQKMTNNCTRAAIATAIAAQIPDRTKGKVIIDQKSLYRCLVAQGQIKASDNTPNLAELLKKSEGGVDPKVFNHTYINVYDYDDNPFRLKILIRDISPDALPNDCPDGFEYLVGYDVYTQDKTRRSPDGKPGLHCICVDEIIDGVIIGFNSWGSVDPKPRMKPTDPFVRIWQILVEEVVTVDVHLKDDERKNLATPLNQDMIDLFDHTRQTFGWAGNEASQKEYGKQISEKIQGPKIVTNFFLNNKKYMTKKISHASTLSETRAQLNLYENIQFEDGCPVLLEDENDFTLEDIVKDKNVFMTDGAEEEKKEFEMETVKQNVPIEGSQFLRKENNLDIYLFPKQQLNLTELPMAKVMMVVGQTGSGKTTLLNYFLNHHMGIQYSDNFRYVILDGEKNQNKKSQAQSQTDFVGEYQIKGYGNSPPIRLIDTPGFGDTRGLTQDKKIAEDIKQFFMKNVDTINVICFVIKSTSGRLDISQRFIFSQILQMFGKDIAKHFVVMITFCDGKKPEVISALEFPGDPNYKNPTTGKIDPQPKSIFLDLIPVISEPWYLKFNSSALFEDSQDQSNMLAKEFWKIGMASFDIFRNQKLLILEKRSLTQTKTVLQERERLECIIMRLQPELQKGIRKIENIKTRTQQVKQNEKLINECKNFEWEEEEPVVLKVPTEVGQFTTYCYTCNRTCHQNCAYKNDFEKQNCCVMKDGRCTVCPQNCQWNVHKNVPYIIKHSTKKVKRHSNTLYQKYSEQKDQKSRTEQILENLRIEFFNHMKECMLQQIQIKQIINELNKIALRNTFLDSFTEDYTDLMIASEQDEQQQGWEARVEGLKKLKQGQQLVRQAYNNEGGFKKLNDFAAEKEYISKLKPDMMDQILKIGGQPTYDQILNSAPKKSIIFKGGLTEEKTKMSCTIF